MKIDHKMADSILDRLGFDLEEIDIYGDGNGSGITHHLFYPSRYSTANLMGYVSCENGIYYVDPANNHASPQQAALELLDRTVVENAALAIELERASAVEYV